MIYRLLIWNPDEKLYIFGQKIVNIKNNIMAENDAYFDF